MTAESDFGDRVRPNGSTSRSLLEEARQSDAAAWHRLVTLYAPLVVFWFRRWGVAEQDIVDLLQEVFSAVAVHLKRFRKDKPCDTFRGWLATIARNKTRDYFRRRCNEPAAAGGSAAWRQLQQIPMAELDSDPNQDQDDPGFSQVLLRALEAIRGEFHERTWSAFWGVVVEGRTPSDVGADLGMRPGTVRVSKSRVLLRLRRELGDIGE